MPLTNDSDTKPDLHLGEGTIAIVPGCALWPWPVDENPDEDGCSEEDDSNDDDDDDEPPSQMLLRGLPVRVEERTVLVSGAEPPETVQGDQWSCAASVDDESEHSERSEHSRPSTSFSVRNRAIEDPNSDDWKEDYHDAGPQGVGDGVTRRAAIENTVVISAAYGGEAAQEAANAAMAQINQAESRRVTPAWLRGAVRPERRIVERWLLMAYDPSAGENALEVMIKLLERLMLSNRDRGSVPFSDIHQAIDLLRKEIAKQEAASAAPAPAPARMSAAEASAILEDHLETLERLKQHAQAFQDEVAPSNTSRSARDAAPPNAAPSSAAPSNAAPSSAAPSNAAPSNAPPFNAAPSSNSPPVPHPASPDNSALPSATHINPSPLHMSAPPSNPTPSGSGAGASSAGGLRMVNDYREFTRYGDGASGSGSGAGWAPEDEEAFWKQIESGGSSGGPTGGGGSSDGPSGGGGGQS